MVKRDIESVPFYFFKNFENYPDLIHFTTTREDGISEGKLTDLNLSFRVNDNPANLIRNRSIVAQSFGINPLKMLFATQTHEDKVAIIDCAYFELGDEQQNSFLNGIDAMVTQLPEVCLCILTADCAAITLYDPVKKVAGIAHAGWKGTAKKIAANTIQQMVESFGCQPANLIAGIGPCIGAEAFEVDEEVAEIFKALFQGAKDIIIRRPEWAKPHIDLVRTNQIVLLNSGVQAKNIESANICTYSNPQQFFSARKGSSGRFASGIMIKKQL
jgi:YfiH family protein